MVFPEIRAGHGLSLRAPALWADTAIYFSLASQFHDRDNGKSIQEHCGVELGPPPVLQEYLGATHTLTAAHLPFRVVAENRPDFEGLRHLLCINAQHLSAEDAERIRNFVRDGGTLLATGLTSLQTPDGRSSGDFALSDVLGVSFTGQFCPSVHYLALSENSYVSCQASAPLVRATGATVRAKLNVPLFPPGDAERYASIHSNPPGRDTEFVGLSEHAFGRGRAWYLASPVLAEHEHDAQLRFAMDLFRSIMPSGLLRETDAPAAVEVSLTRATAAAAVLVALVNWQADLPNIPARNIALTLTLPKGAQPIRCTRVSDGTPQPFAWSDGLLRFTVPIVETLEMIEVDCEEG